MCTRVALTASATAHKINRIMKKRRLATADNVLLIKVVFMHWLFGFSMKKMEDGACNTTCDSMLLIYREEWSNGEQTQCELNFPKRYDWLKVRFRSQWILNLLMILYAARSTLN